MPDHPNLPIHRPALRSAAALAMGMLITAPAAAQLTLRLTSVPGGTPPGAPIYVAGSFNGWSPADSAFRLRAEAGGRYSITLPPSVLGRVEFKFTRGSWQTVELDSAGAGIANRAFVVPATGPAEYTAAIARWDEGGPPAPAPRTATRSVSVMDTAFAIPQLGRTRRVWVYLPPDYATSNKTYPVLYMHDGQNVFDASTSYAGEWGVDEALDSLHAAGDPGAIVVAVDNGQRERMNEYSPWTHPQAGGGQGDGYVDFIARTLKPYVDSHYRTRPDAMSTGIMGSSMGGLISLYAALKHPGVFGRVGVFSPSLWFSDSAFTMARAAPHRPGQRWYFASGGSEGPPDNRGIVVQGQRMMIDSLAAAGFVRGAELFDSAPEDGTHQEWFWRREFPAAYRWLFADPPAAAPSRAAPIE